MGLLGKIFRRNRGEEKLTQAPSVTQDGVTPKRVMYKSGQPRTKKQRLGRARAMRGRKDNVKRMIAARR